jgi:hypothetical protein
MISLLFRTKLDAVSFLLYTRTTPIPLGVPHVPVEWLEALYKSK